MNTIAEQAIAALGESIAHVDQLVALRKSQKMSESKFTSVARELREIRKALTAICNR